MFKPRIIKRLYWVFARNFHVTTSMKGGNVSSESYDLIYQLPAVPIVAMISRMKVYQTGLATGGSALSMVLDQLNLISTSTFHVIAYAGFALCVPLYTIGFFSNRVVGKMYVSKDRKILKVGFINFWGKRENVLIDVEDIVPFSEMKTKANDMYFNLELYSGNKKYKLSHTYGKIEDNELFSNIFGENKL